ncbi:MULTISPECIES: hypothetical protein [unclassified Streptomyces]|uniref:hypothetical protein n=1 Tax=unclassified Streptomyces TaxID=2593676 RepID=UPI0029AC3BCD|nr:MULTISPECIES: hypothetical protein [unclassified Streptomyces]MDX3772207.1 hypothetical protein [Streptomyces sp. AK08-01B]MDX3821744.1 hypothetical protein [Streptomyces sp. AK08-01A]WSQ24534.1 hypothetical protein OG763_00860 [Streptomyces sp. NBC_01230]
MEDGRHKHGQAGPAIDDPESRAAPKHRDICRRSARCGPGPPTAPGSAEHGEQWADPSTPAFVGIDRHGHITGGLVPDSVTRAVTRISKRAGVPIHWTGHSLRIGLSSTARKRGRDGIAIADQGG